jgi:hypothetical protein
MPYRLIFTLWMTSHLFLVAQKPDPEASSIFEKLTYSDNRETALTKLKASKAVEMTTPETLISRTGLNGVFRTRKKIGNLNVSLYFDWNEAGNLKELTLQTDALPAGQYKTQLEPCWTQCIGLLSELHGDPIKKGNMPGMSSVPDGSFLPSHIWKVEAGGTARLGTAREGSNYQLVIRFSNTSEQPSAGLPGL